MKRPNGVGRTATPSTVRLTATSWQVAERAAETLGVSRDAYFEALMRREAEQLDDTGRPAWWTTPAPGDQQELLPLPRERTSRRPRSKEVTATSGVA